MEALEAIDKYFRSGNSVPVERATIRREEWEALKAAIEQMKQDHADEMQNAVSNVFLGGYV